MKNTLGILAVVMLATLAGGQDFDGPQTEGSYTNIVTADRLVQVDTGPAKQVNLSLFVKSPDGERLEDVAVVTASGEEVGTDTVSIADWAAALGVTQNDMLLALKSVATNSWAVKGYVPSK